MGAVVQFFGQDKKCLSCSSPLLVVAFGLLCGPGLETFPL